MLVIDTNVLVYAADQDSEFYGHCRSFLEARVDDASPTYLTWGICYEFLRVVTHRRVFHHPWKSSQAWDFLEALLDIDSFSLLVPSARHAAVLSQTLNEMPEIRGNLVHDLHTAVLMREHGIGRIGTRDHDFHQFPFIDIVDPLRPE